MAEYINRERARFEAKRYFKNMDEIQEDLDMLFCMLPAENVAPVQEWISVDEKLPQNFISVLGYMTDAGEFPPVRECYTVGNVFFFPALGDIHPVSHWREMPPPPKGE